MTRAQTSLHAVFAFLFQTKIQNNWNFPHWCMSFVWTVGSQHPKRKTRRFGESKSENGVLDSHEGVTASFY